MSVKVRPYRRGGWEVDVRVQLPNGRERRERKRAPALVHLRCNRLPDFLAAHSQGHRLHRGVRAVFSERSACSCGKPAIPEELQASSDKKRLRSAAAVLPTHWLSGGRVYLGRRHECERAELPMILPRSAHEWRNSGASALKF